MEARRLYARAERWTDAFRASHPDRVPFTFWMYWRNRYPRDAGLRIDHLLLNASRRPTPAPQRHGEAKSVCSTHGAGRDEMSKGELSYSQEPPPGVQ